MSELAIKNERLWSWLRGMNLDGVLISRRSNFAWYTAGVDSRIFWSSEAGASSLLIAPEGAWLVAHTMDAARMLDEQIGDIAIRHAFHQWFEPRSAILRSLVAGRRFGSDTPTDGFELISRPWSEIVFPLTSTEIERTRAVAKLADYALNEVCRTIRPGETEVSIASRTAR